MNSTLASYAASYRQANDEAEALVQPLTAEQFNWKPDATSWSVAECLVHLNTANAPYAAAIRERIAEGGPQGQGPFRYGWFARMFVKSIAPEGTLKMKTAPSMNPKASQHDKAAVLDEFNAINATLLEQVERAEGLDVSKIRIASPFLKAMRLPVGAFLEALAGHELRHLRQAQRVTEHPGFPKA
ncbi:MAG: DinB family protein [Rhodothermaceae bacterium]|nr:DinB family protein [Rhodothermaceae bacterium]